MMGSSREQQSQFVTAVTAKLISEDTKQISLVKNTTQATQQLISPAIELAPSSEVKKAYVKNKTSLFEKIFSSKIGLHTVISSYLIENAEAKNNTAPNDDKETSKKTPDLKTASAFVITSKPNLLTDLFKEKVLEVELKRQAKELCQAVVYGNYDKVKEMLDKNPRLVFYKARVQDYSFYEEEEEKDEKGNKKRIYRESEGTALQLALGAEDISRDAHPDEGIADLIKSYFVKAYHNNEAAAQAEITKQFQEQYPEKAFPEYYEADEKKREEILKSKNTNNPDLIAVEEIVQAISDSKAINETDLNQDKILQAAFKQFRKHFKPKDVIVSGKQFNMQMLIRAFELYDQKFDKMGGKWDSAKNMYFWQKVIGYIQRFLPACYASAFCQGLYDVVDENEKLVRSLRFYDGAAYYPLDSVPASRLGYNWGAVGAVDAAGVRGLRAGGWRLSARALVKTYVEQKQSRCAALCRIQNVVTKRLRA